jgi:hypothetical protein
LLLKYVMHNYNFFPPPGYFIYEQDGMDEDDDSDLEDEEDDDLDDEDEETDPSTTASKLTSG